MNAPHPDRPTAQPAWTTATDRRTDVHELLAALEAVRTHLGSGR